jgi:serine/threonine protein kinase
MAKNTFGKQTIEQIIVQMIQAIEDLHDLGFVHTDIKPDIFRIKNNRVFIIDLEHAREFVE